MDPTHGIRRFSCSGFAGEGFGGDSSSLDRANYLATFQGSSMAIGIASIE